MVSTITESFFRAQFGFWGHDRLQSCQWLQLCAANGLAIPYVGYLELEVELCGKVIPCCGILVVKDPPGASSSPGILGMNVIRRCYQELFGVFGSSLFESPFVSGAPGPVVAALQKCHQTAVQPNPQGDVRVRGGQVVRIPGGVMKLVAATCSEQFSASPSLSPRAASVDDSSNSDLWLLVSEAPVPSIAVPPPFGTPQASSAPAATAPQGACSLTAPCLDLGANLALSLVGSTIQKVGVDVAGSGLPSEQVSYGGSALIGGWGEKVYIRHCLQLILVVFPPSTVRRGCGLSGRFDQQTVSQREHAVWQRQEGWCFLPPSFHLERFAVRARALVYPGQLTAGWRRWVALPQREPFTEWWRHQTVGTDYLAYWTHCCFGSVPFAGLSPVHSRALSLSRPPPFARGTALRRQVLRATAGTQPLVEGV
ncbi:hypothetical protein D4764_0250440, partial [Takifugu flavidus]